MEVSFTKAVASGNDFIIIDAVKDRNSLPLDNISDFVIKACTRHLSIGSDGVLLIEPSESADIRMRIFNPDGKEVSMCGNGSRCAALYAAATGLTGKEMSIETLAGELKSSVDGNRVKVAMTVPKALKKGFPLSLGKDSCDISFVDTGVPHVIIFFDDIETVDVNGLGGTIRYHKDFDPAGTNVNFVKVIGKDEIEVRTYERGVEGETLACGTGSVASAIMANAVHGTQSPVKVRTRSGESLLIHFTADVSGYKDVFMEGNAEIVYNGGFNYV